MSDYSLVEDEFARFLLVHVGEVERDAHDVTLDGIIFLIVVIIDDVQVTILDACRHILEIIEVERVAEDIVAVAALKGADLRLQSKNLLALVLRVVKRSLLLLGQDLDAQVLCRIFILLDSPVTVLVIEGDPVVVDIFVKLQVTDLK